MLITCPKCVQPHMSIQHMPGNITPLEKDNDNENNDCGMRPRIYLTADARTRTTTGTKLMARQHEDGLH